MTIRVVLEFRTDEWSVERSENLRMKIHKALNEDETEHGTIYSVKKDLITLI